MKTLSLLTAALIFLLFPSFSSPSELGNIRTGYIDGDVQLKPEGLTEWVPLSINTPLREKDSIWVPEAGRLEIQLLNGSFLRLDENSFIEVYAIDGKDFFFDLFISNRFYLRRIVFGIHLDSYRIIYGMKIVTY